MNKVIKRDGRTVRFDRERIINAVKRAFEATEGETFDDYALNKANHIADYVEKHINEQNKNVSVENIQDIVEKGLMSCKKKDVAKEYILYREKRTRERDRNSKFRHVIKTKLMATDVQNQNANVDEHSFGGRTGEAASELNRQVALDEVISPMARRNHLNNEVYIHDCDHYILGDHNCLSVPFDDLLKNGFNTRQTDVRPANSVNTAFQLVAVIFQIQSLNQFGGVSATHIDWTMIPYVRKSFMKHYITAMLKDTDDFAKLNLMQMLFETYKEPVYGRYTITRDKFDDWVDEHKEQILKDNNLTQNDFYFDNENLNPKYKQSAMFDTIKETYQAVEGMFHNLNTLQSRSGNQLGKVAGFTVM